MAKLRNISGEKLQVPLADATVDLDGIVEVSDAVWAQHAWPETIWAEVEVPRRIFDPSQHSVADVNAYLDKAEDDERERVLAAERSGKSRVGVLGNDDSGEK